MAGCESGIDAIPSDLVGRWEWVESRAVGLPGTVSPETVGKEFTIEFTKDAAYNEYVNGQIAISGHYSIEEGSIFSAPDTLFPIIMVDTTVFFDSLFWEPAGQALLRLEGDSLITEGTDSDSYTHLFKRVN
jgi:hypothetical protein